VGHKRAQAEGGELRLLMPTSAAVQSVFALTGIGHLIPSFTGLDQALESAPAAARGDRDPGCAPARTGGRPILALDRAWPEGHPVRHPARAAAGTTPAGSLPWPYLFTCP
jgi:hypothetical protein